MTDVQTSTPDEVSAEEQVPVITVMRRPDRPFMLIFYVRQRLNESWATLTYQQGHRVPAPEVLPGYPEIEYGKYAEPLAEQASDVGGVELVHVEGYELGAVFAPSYTPDEIVENVAGCIASVLGYATHTIAEIAIVPVGLPKLPQPLASSPPSQPTSTGLYM